MPRKSWWFAQRVCLPSTTTLGFIYHWPALCSTHQEVFTFCFSLCQHPGVRRVNTYLVIHSYLVACTGANPSWYQTEYTPWIRSTLNQTPTYRNKRKYDQDPAASPMSSTSCYFTFSTCITLIHRLLSADLLTSTSPVSVQSGHYSRHT